MSLKDLSLAQYFFSLYMLPLGSVFRKYGISFHCYVDDSQIYFPLKNNSIGSLKVLLDRLYDIIKSWLALNFLYLNAKQRLYYIDLLTLVFLLRVIWNLEKSRTPFAKNDGTFSFEN